MNNFFKIAFAAAVFSAIGATTAAAGSTSLLNTVEYRTDNLDALPQWQKTLGKIAREQSAYIGCDKSAKGCASKTIHDWQAMIGKLEGQSQVKQLKAVNDFINKSTYRTDNSNYGKSDYWASPAEFFSRSGDCEDYAIAKYVTLRQLGFSADQLRLVVVKELRRGLAHAVLAAYVDGEVFILDNLSNEVRSQASVVAEYAPYYSVNEQARWAHAEKPAKVASASGLFSKS